MDINVNKTIFKCTIFLPKFTIYSDSICYHRQSQSYKCRKVPNCDIINANYLH